MSILIMDDKNIIMTVVSYIQMLREVWDWGYAHLSVEGVHASQSPLHASCKNLSSQQLTWKKLQSGYWEQSSITH